MICQHCDDSGVEENEDGQLRVCPSCNSFYGNNELTIENDFEWKELIWGTILSIVMLLIIVIVFCI